MKTRLIGAALAAAASVSLAVAITPAGATVNAGKLANSAAPYARSFDTHLLNHSNSARTTKDRHDYGMNHKLWVVAHAWALHLAATGVLEHNPNLTTLVTKKCPNWTDIGENVGMVTGTDPDVLFQAYMHSPEHRANILDKHYHQVGIATVQTVTNGQITQWDVMDFGNHC